MNQHASIFKASEYDTIQAAIRYLSENGPDIADLAGFSYELGLTERRLTDLFRRWCGLSPKSFAQAVALDHAKNLLRANETVLDTAYEVGLSSTGRLHDLFVTYEAMPPGIFKAGGAGIDMVWGTASSPFGHAVVTVTEYGMSGLGFSDESTSIEKAFQDLASRWPNARFTRDDAKVAPIIAHAFDPTFWSPDRPVRVVLIGTDFEVKVWDTLLKIPVGSATTYQRVADHVGRPASARAVGSAVAKNPISFVVPCHRVVGVSGALTGYHWGLPRKRAMLGWEVGVLSKRD